jgi:4-hydroxy-2-oxovalerate aldolase
MPDQVGRIVADLDSAGVDLIEVAHGFGLGASCLEFGIAKSTDSDRLDAARAAVRSARLCTLVLPGVATSDDIRAAVDRNVTVFRVATHCTEATMGAQHVRLVRHLGQEAYAFLMMSHTASPAELVRQARILEVEGTTGVYVVDSAGTMLPKDVRARVSALVGAMEGSAIGFHGHNNLGLAVANTLEAVDAGADLVDASLLGLGAGAGNTPIEVLAAVLGRLGLSSKLNFVELADLANREIRHLRQHIQGVERRPLCSGYSGLSKSLTEAAELASDRWRVRLQTVLEEMSGMNLLDGQEDLADAVARSIAQGGPRSNG